MFRKLLVPLDGSDSAERALPYAVQLARAGQGGLTLVRVAHAPPSMSVEGVDWVYYQRQGVEDAERAIWRQLPPPWFLRCPSRQLSCRPEVPHFRSSNRGGN